MVLSGGYDARQSLGEKYVVSSGEFDAEESLWQFQAPVQVSEKGNVRNGVRWR